MPDIRHLLSGAAVPTGEGPDLDAVRSRVARRRRRRLGGGVAASVVVTSVVIGAVLGMASGSPSHQEVRVVAPPSTPPTVTLPPTTTPVPPTTTPVPPTTTPAPSSTTVAPPVSPPVIGSAVTATADGITMDLSSTPRTGTVGTTAIRASVTITGAAPVGTVEFFVGSGPGDEGQPWADQSVPTTGPGTYAMAPFEPTLPGDYAVSANVDDAAGVTLVTISGLPANAGLPYPHSGLLTVVTGSAAPPTTTVPTTTTLPGTVDLAAGSSLTVAGSGCQPGAAVTVIAAAQNASGDNIGQATADASGSFSTVVTVPYMGQPDADVGANCVAPDGNSTNVVEIPIHYTSP